MSKESGKRIATDGMNSDHAADGEKERTRPQSKRAKHTITSDDETECLIPRQSTITPEQLAKTAKPASPASPCNDEAEASNAFDAEIVAIRALLELGTSNQQDTELSDPGAQRKGLSRAQRNPRQEQIVVERGTQAFGNNDSDPNKALKAKAEHLSLVKVIPETEHLAVQQKHAQKNSQHQERIKQLESCLNQRSEFIKAFIFSPWYQSMMLHYQRVIAAQQQQQKDQLEASEKKNVRLKEVNESLKAHKQQLEEQLEAERNVNANLKEEIRFLEAENNQLKEQLEAEDVIDLTEDGGER